MPHEIEPLTQRWDLQLSVLAREQLYKQIVEAAHEGICVADDSGRTIFVNDRLAAMLGVAADEMIGRPLTDFVREEDRALLQPIDRRGTVSREVRFTARGGKTVSTLVNVSPLNDDGGGMLTMVVDVTTRRAAEDALRQSEQRLKTIFETEPACVKLVTPDGHLIDMNRAGLQMIDADDKSELIGQELVTLVHVQDRERFVHTIRTAAAGTPASAEIRVVGLRGSLRWLETHAVPFDRSAVERGELSIVLCVTHDLTQRKRLENDLHQSQKLEAVGRLAGGVAHDFNNLLTAILGYCDFSEMQLPAGHPVRDELVHIRAAGDRAVSLTAQLLAFSRKQILRPRVIDVNETVSGLLAMMPRVIGEHIEMTTELDPDLLHVKVDPTQLEQVLLNLALNARDAMPSGGSLHIQTSNIVLNEAPVTKARDFEPGPYVRLTVTDTGTGMDAETESRVFEPFFTTKDVGRGTGLGLSTVYGIVKQSRGFIAITTAPGRGTTFTIDLPATDAPVEAMAETRHPQPRGGEETVLLVEDADAVRELERRALESNGYRVLVASDPLEAIDIATDEGGRIDILVTDVIMPHMTGPQLAADISQRYPSIRTLFVSGYSGSNPPPPGGETTTRLLKKPFTPNQLVETVRNVLDEE